MRRYAIPPWLSALAETAAMPIVVSLWVINSLGLMALSVGVVFALMLAINGDLPHILLIAWGGLALFLGLLNFKICFDWLGGTPRFSMIGFYLNNSAIIVFSFFSLRWLVR